MSSNWELEIALTLNNKCLLSNNFDFILKSPPSLSPSLSSTNLSCVRFYTSFSFFSLLWHFYKPWRQNRRKGMHCQFKNSVIILNQYERFSGRKKKEEIFQLTKHWSQSLDVKNLYVSFVCWCSMCNQSRLTHTHTHTTVTSICTPKKPTNSIDDFIICLLKVYILKRYTSNFRTSPLPKKQSSILRAECQQNKASLHLIFANTKKKRL